MFCVGDKIVHPMHGAGVIESIVDEKIGRDLVRPFSTMSFLSLT